MDDTAGTTLNTKDLAWQQRALEAEKLLAQTQSLLDDALREIAYLKAQVRLLTAKRFSSSSEKTSHIDQQKVNVKKTPPGLLGGGCVMLVSFSSVYGNSRGFRETRA
jgi:hypothetical protein